MIKLAIVNDLHAGSDTQFVRGSLSFALLEQTLKELTLHKPDLLIDLGDRSNDDHPYELFKYLERLGNMFSAFPAPRVHMLGNHDFLHPVLQHTYLGSKLDNQVLQLQGWQFIFLNAFDGSVNGAFTRQDLNWLEQCLKDHTSPAILFTHQPIDEQNARDNALFAEFPHWLHSKGSQDVRAMLEAYGKVPLVISGHGHWTHLETLSGINYLTLDAFVPSALSDDTRASYALLEIDHAAIRVQIVGRKSQRFIFHL